MKFISVCSGIEAATQAFAPLGWEAVCYSEIEPFPCAVLAHHYPDTPNVGDMMTFDWKQYRGKADVVIGGTPCQSFSIAGLRGGLDDDRGNLTLKFVEVCNDVGPDYIVWENVPGVLSDKTNAFGCLLAGLVGAGAPLVSPLERGRWTDAGMVVGPTRTAAWRILDAQFFGLAQRRRRVFVVSCPRNGANPSEILFEIKGLPGDTPKGRKAGEGITHDIAPSVSASGRGFERVGESRGKDPVVACTARCTGDGFWNDDGLAGIRAHPGGIPENLIAFNHQSGGSKMQLSPSINKANTVQKNQEQCIAFTQNQAGDVLTGDKIPSVGTNSNATGRNTPKILYSLQSVNCPRERKQNGIGISDGDTMYTCTGRDQHAVCYENHGQDSRINEVDKSPQIKAQAGTGGNNLPLVQNLMSVRRLTVTEVERLFGMADGYTNIPYGRPKYPDQICPDGHRYRALGNSMAVPVIRWIGRRIDQW